MQYSLFTCVDDEYWYLWYYTNNQIAGDQNTFVRLKEKINCFILPSALFNLNIWGLFAETADFSFYVASIYLF